MSRIAHLPGRSVRYLEAGAGQPLVCLHAFPLSADQWLPLLQDPPPGFRVIAPDLRGFRGESSDELSGGPRAAAAGDLAGVTIDTHAKDGPR